MTKRGSSIFLYAIFPKNTFKLWLTYQSFGKITSHLLTHFFNSPLRDDLKKHRVLHMGVLVACVIF